jgi:serine/threonine-protein kinase
MSDVDQRLGSRYILKERLGRGAMGTVWRAVNTDTNQFVAVKVLSEELSDEPEMIARFIQERNTLMAVQHPNLVRIHDMVVEDSRLAIVMDLVQGQDLHRIRVQRGTLALAEVAAIGRGVADALTAIHAAGIIHRDLKPANILLDLTGPAPEPRLVDFGIARMLDGTRLTARSSVVGTPEYLSPEAISGGEATAAIDIYAFGIALYELFTGQTPFHGDQLLQVLNQHMYQEPPWPASIPPQILPLLQAMLAKNPLQRPTARDLLAAMTALSQGAALPARPPLQPLPPAQSPVPGQPAPVQVWQPAPPQSPIPGAGPGTPLPGTPVPYGQVSPLPYGQTSPVPGAPFPAQGYPQPGQGPTPTPLPGSGMPPAGPAPSPSGFFYPQAEMFAGTGPSAEASGPPSSGSGSLGGFVPGPPPFTEDMFEPKRKPGGNRKKALLIGGAVVAVLAIAGGAVALASGGGGNKPVASGTSSAAASATASPSPTAPSCPAQTGPVPAARWTLTGAAADCASTSNALALANGAAFATQDPRGQVLRFSGGYACATVPLTGLIDTSNSFTVSVWVYLDSYSKSQYATVVSFMGQTQGAFELQYNPGWKSWAFNRSSADSLGAKWIAAAGTAYPQTGTWTHLVGEYDADAKTLSLYVDGKAVATRTGISGWKATGKLSVGANLNSGGAAYEGMTGDVSNLEIFDSALSADEIAALQ